MKKKQMKQWDVSKNILKKIEKESKISKKGFTSYNICSSRDILL